MENTRRKQKIQNFRDLEVWQLGMAIVRETYELTKGFPQDERFGLIAETRRSARSVPSNISEGFNRDSNKDYRRFLGISLGSCAELETQFEIALGEGYITLDTKEEIISKLGSEQRMLRSLMKKL